PFGAGIPLLRLSDPVMLGATRELTGRGVAYIGPAADVLERCYDKLEASRLAAANGIACPGEPAPEQPVVIKPRRGSDSLGLRVLRPRPSLVPDGYLLQEHALGLRGEPCRRRLRPAGAARAATCSRSLSLRRGCRRRSRWSCRLPAAAPCRWPRR